MHRTTLPMVVYPTDLNAALIADGFGRLLEGLLTNPRALKLKITAPKGIFIDIRTNGMPFITYSGTKKDIPQGLRWIADYPTPLPLPRTLYFEPVSGNRFRVTDHLTHHVPQGFWLIPLAFALYAATYLSLSALFLAIILTAALFYLSRTR